MMTIQLRAYDALNFQKGPCESGTVSQRVQFQMEPHCVARDLCNFFNTLNLSRIAWEHQGDGLYDILLPHEQSSEAFEQRLNEWTSLGHHVPFQPRVLESQSLGKKFPGTDTPPPLRYQGWDFEVTPVYNSSELMDLLDACEARGAWFKHLSHLKSGLYEIRVPDTIDPLPFSQTIDDCDSTKNIECSGFDCDTSLHPTRRLKS